MEKEQKKKTYVQLNAPYRIKYEGIQEFDQSIFRSAYRQAALITKEIVKKNEEYHNNPQKRGNVYRNNEQIYNILSFVGDRGSGKSSCMLSYAEYLKDYHRLRRSSVKDKYYVGERAVFVGINAIDAGLLEDKEDIVDVVLASLLEQFRRLEEEGRLIKGEDYEFRRREFNQCLQKLYKSNLSRKTGGISKESASFNELHDMAVSFNMRENIKELINKYISLIKQRYLDEYIRETEYYVLIPIDDIDMNITKGYDMLEQIRRYLMVPNVIVMLSYKYGQLKDICDLYYINKLEKLSGMYKNTEEELGYKISNLSRCYMAKAVPDGRRIVLPQINNQELFEDDEIFIIPVGSEETLETRKKNAHNISKTFLRKVSRCFSIRYPYGDMGMKIWETERLRDLCNLYDELHTLKDPENTVFQTLDETKDSKIRENIYEENYIWLMGYLDRKAKKDLKDSEYKSLTWIMNQPLDDLNHEILKSCRSWLTTEYRGTLDTPMFIDKGCYGTSLYWLNQMNRKNEHTMFPVFVKAYLTAVMGRICFSEPDNSKEKLEKIFQKNQMMGYYNNKIFPSVHIARNRDEVKLNLGYIQQLPSAISDSIVKDKKIDIEVLKKAEVFFMFLSNMKKSSDSLPLAQHTLCIPKCDFNILNFIWNIFEYKSHLEKLYAILEDYLVKKMSCTNEEAKTELEEAKKVSLFKDLQIWCENKERYVFPVYNAEFMSCILEKCKDLFENTSFIIKEDLDDKWKEINSKVSEYAIEFMNQIYVVLKEQDDFYEGAKRQGEEIEYWAKSFSSCPVIKYIRDGSSLIPPEITIVLDQSDAIKEAREQMD